MLERPKPFAGEPKPHVITGPRKIDTEFGQWSKAGFVPDIQPQDQIGSRPPRRSDSGMRSPPCKKIRAKVCAWSRAKDASACGKNKIMLAGEGPRATRML